MTSESIKIHKGESIRIYKPNKCPHCGSGIDPVVIGSFLFESFQQPWIYVCFKCPLCEQTFFAKYCLESPCCGAGGQAYPYSEVLGGHGLTKEFPKEISELSPEFVETYNDAYKAEQNGCTKIVGIGYRLAFERLVKDYCSWKSPADKDKIPDKPLGQCIEDYFDDGSKAILKRAAWLGNDFAHCESKHPDFDLDDLKSIIDICVSRIEANIIERKYLAGITRK